MFTWNETSDAEQFAIVPLLDRTLYCSLSQALLLLQDVTSMVIRAYSILLTSPNIKHPIFGMGGWD